MKNPQKKNLSNVSPIRFFYVWNYLEWGGAQVYFFGLMKKAKEVGQVTAVLPIGSNEQLLKFLDNLEVPYKFFNAHADLKPAATVRRKLQRHWNKIACEWAMTRFLRNLEFRNSVTHVELAPWQSFLAILWLCRRTEVFVTVHNSVLPIPKMRRPLWQLKFRLLAGNKNFHLFTANQDAKESLMTLVPKDFYERIAVTYANINPTEIDEATHASIDRSELRMKFNLPADKFLVFCVGQFIDRKGRWIFLAAAQKLLKENSDIAFVWISNSKPSNKDLQRASEFNLGENFIFITSEQVGGKHVDLFKLLRMADVFALPSFLEGLPISLLEAMALGIPSVSTAINGIPEALKHLETGYLIDAGNSDALVKAIRELKDNQTLRETLSKNGRKFVLENFSENVVAEVALERYLESLRKN